MRNAVRLAIVSAVYLVYFLTKFYIYKFTRVLTILCVFMFTRSNKMAKLLKHGNVFVFWIGEFLGIEKSVAVMYGDGSQMLRGRMGTETCRMGMDTTSAVMDGDGLIFHYRAGL